MPPSASSVSQSYSNTFAEVKQSKVEVLSYGCKAMHPDKNPGSSKSSSKIIKVEESGYFNEIPL